MVDLASLHHARRFTPGRACIIPPTRSRGHQHLGKAQRFADVWLACRNLNYWDSVSTLAGEVPRPHKTVPRALGSAVVLVVVTYVGPLLVGLGVTTQVHDWKLGYFAYIAKQVCPAVGQCCSIPGGQARACARGCVGGRPACSMAGSGSTALQGVGS